MSTRPRVTTRPSGRDSVPVPALAAVTTTAAGAGRAATTPQPVVGSVCTGYGGLDLGVLAALGGGRIAWCADPDPHITRILAARMPGVPNLGDIRAIAWTAVEPVDVLTAGFPCQDISAAGRRAGIQKGSRSGLWADIMAGVRLLRPALVVLENVAALRWRNGGLHRVLGDLAQAGYDALWRSVRAADVGAAHRRERVFLLAWPRLSRDGGGVGDREDRTRRLIRWHQRHRQSQQSARAGCVPAAPDTDGLGREELHAPHSDRGSVAAGRGAAAADPASLRHRHGGTQGRSGLPAAAVAAGAPAGGPADVAADTARDGRDERLPGAARLQRRPDAALGGHPPAHPTVGQGTRRHLIAVPDPRPESTDEPVVRRSSRSVQWGVYEAAIRRWETVLGRPAPYPTQPGNHGRPVLAPAFVEHLMGLTVGLENDNPARTQSPRRSSTSDGPAASARQMSCTDSSATSGVTSEAGNADDVEWVDWGEYEPAIRRWEAIMGRPAPHPTQPGRHGRPVLSTRFVEFLMGLDDGFVSSLDIPRTAQLRALGNGVVPQQATYAIRLLLADLAAVSGLDDEGGWAA